MNGGAPLDPRIGHFRFAAVEFDANKFGTPEGPIKYEILDSHECTNEEIG